MAYYALLSPAYIGHINPMCVLAHALMRRRHRVAMIAPLDAQKRILRAGVEFIPIGELELPRGEWDRRTDVQGELTGIAASRHACQWIADCARGIVRDLPNIIERERFDGLVMDQISIGAEAVCQVHNIPLAVACNALALHWEPGVPPPNSGWRYESSLRARIRNCIGHALFSSLGTSIGFAVSRYRRQHRLGQMWANHINSLPPSLVQVAQQPAFFDFPRRKLPKHFHYTAPWKEPAEAARRENDFPWHPLDGRPLIYASLGTLQNRLDHLFAMIAEACVGLDAQLVIALGRKDNSAPENLPGNPIVVGYAPQMALLQRAYMVITHGGLNSTLETLREGLPMVVIPITNDQPGVATRLEYLGAARRLQLRDLGIKGARATPDNERWPSRAAASFVPSDSSGGARLLPSEGATPQKGSPTLPANPAVAKLRSAIQDIFTNPKYRQTTQRLAAELNKIDGPALAAQLIEQAFTTRQPVLRNSHS